MQTTVNTMKQASHYLLLCVLLVLGLSSCHKDFDESSMSSTETPPPSVSVLSQHDVIGYIYNENGEGVAGAEVNILGESTVTDSKGLYSFQQIDLDRNGTYVKATKTGYMLGSDRIYPNTARTAHSYIKMLSLEGAQSYNTSNGGTINVLGGGEVNFSSGALVRADGSSYEGAVNVTAKRIATDDKDLSDVMPGGLVAIDSEGRTRALATIGMVAIELRDNNGMELNLADGQEAEITFPIAANQQSNAPSEIELWSFNEESGLWEEEGLAVREGNLYRGQVSHFSFWNCDAPYPLVHICGQVLYEDGTPAANLQVNITADVTWGSGYGWTDSEGWYCGKVPQNEELIISVVYYECNQVNQVTTTVAPLPNDTNLDPIILPFLENSALITGMVECNGVAVPYASIFVDGPTQRIFSTDENGTFSFNTSSLGCTTDTEATLVALDNLTGQSSETISFLLGEDGSYTLNTCGDCNIAVETSYMATEPCNYESYEATATVTGGSGDYSYLWETGAITATISSLPTGITCVTVTDNINECDQISCVTFYEYGVGDSLSVTNPICGLDNGTINFLPFGGTAPYTYEMSFNGVPVSTTADNTDLAAGLYGYTITDNEGCTFNSEVELVSTELSFELITQSDCGAGYFQVFGPANGLIITYQDEIYPNGVLNVTESGTYCFTISNDQGCSEEVCEDIVINTELETEIFVSNGCGSSTIQAIGLDGDEFLNIIYENNDYDILTVTESGTYCFTVSNNQGCSSEQCQDIIVNTELEAEIVVSGECGNSYIQVFGIDGNSNLSITYEGENYMETLPVTQSGLYCFTVSNELGCSSEFCQEVEVSSELDSSFESECDGNTQYLYFSPGGTFGNYETETGNIIALSGDGVLVINPIVDGFSGTLNLFGELNNCTYSGYLELSSTDALVTTVTPDGIIDISLDPDEECQSCDIQSTRIYAISDVDFANDLSGENENGALSTGSYYVVLYDVNGCIIASNLVEL